METETVTPINVATAALRDATPQGLLDTFAALTHRMHGLTDRSVSTRTKAAELRQQRDMVRAELMRRMGGW